MATAACACVVINPGHLPTTNFQQVDATKWICPVGLLRSRTITIALTSPNPLPDGYTLAIHLSTARASASCADFRTEFTYIGYISNAVPSASLAVPITLLDTVAPVEATVGIALEPQSTIDNLEQQTQRPNTTVAAVAHRIANDLVEHVLSFPSEMRMGTEVVCFPISSLHKWVAGVTKRMCL